jgi:3-hydroxypropanoate dehydrogenase
MNAYLNDESLDQIFRAARSYNSWKPHVIDDVTLEALHDLTSLGPTSANCCPGRFIFLRSDAAKARLKPHLLPANVDKVMTASAVAIIGYDLEFYEKIPQLFPHNPGAQDWFTGNDPLIQETAMRNGTLQGAYLMIAARSLGLDCGPMSGFDQKGVNEEFFSGTSIKSNFICSLGVGDPKSLFARSPRLAFQDACQTL